MAGEIIIINGRAMFIDYADGEGRATVNGRMWRWEFHDYLGPTWLRQDGEPRRCQCPRSREVWEAFERWYADYQKKKAKPRRKRKELAIQ